MIAIGFWLKLQQQHHCCPNFRDGMKRTGVERSGAGNAVNCLAAIFHWHFNYVFVESTTPLLGNFHTYISITLSPSRRMSLNRLIDKRINLHCSGCHNGQKVNYWIAFRPRRRSIVLAPIQSRQYPVGGWFHSAMVPRCSHGSMVDGSGTSFYACSHRTAVMEKPRKISPPWLLYFGDYT